MELTVTKRRHLVCALSWLAGYVTAPAGAGNGGENLASREMVLSVDLVREDFDFYIRTLLNTNFIEEKARELGLDGKSLAGTLGDPEFLAAAKTIVLDMVGAITQKR